MRKLGCEGQAGAKLNKRTESNTLGPWATVLRRNGDGLSMQGRGLADGALLRSFSTMALPHPPGGGGIYGNVQKHSWIVTPGVLLLLASSG